MRLAEAGHETIHVADLGLTFADDRTIWHAAVERGAIIVSKDEDFVVLSVRVGTGPQIVWLRIGNVGNRVLWSKVAGTLPQIVAALDLGERVIEVR